jgi:hypothetical protein
MVLLAVRSAVVPQMSLATTYCVVNGSSFTDATKQWSAV